MIISNGKVVKSAKMESRDFARKGGESSSHAHEDVALDRKRIAV